MDTYTYRIDNKIYINLTNRCTNNCLFCIRNNSDGLSGYYLWLKREPESAEIIEQLKDLEGIEEVVFCGFGEPLMRWKEVIKISKFIKSKNVPVRINTNGQADLFAEKDIVPLIAPYTDRINISLNEVTAEDYDKICNSVYGKDAFGKMLDFAKRCKEFIPKVTLSVVDVIGEEKIRKAQEIADRLGVKLRVRPFIS